jgi:hypothetical protein
MITETTYTVTVLEASEGSFLTQSADVELENRIFSTKVFLGANDDSSNWKSITKATKEKYVKQQEELTAARQAEIKKSYEESLKKE